MLPVLRFEDQKLTSFSGLVIFQRLFEYLGLKQRLRQCFKHMNVSPIFGHANIVLLLVIHMLLGYRDLRHVRYYEGDPLVGHLLGLKRLPTVATISRTLSETDEKIESFFGSLKQKQVQWQHYQTRYEAQQDILEYITMFYNTQRLHSYLDYMSPCDYEQKLLKMEKAA